MFADFATSSVCKAIFERHYPSNDSIQWVDNDKYTHAILLNKATPSLTVPKTHVVGFSLEPPEILNVDNAFVSFVTNTCDTYYIGDFLHGARGAPFALHHGFLWHISPIRNAPKPNVMSIMVSDKKYAPGHKYRHDLVKRILQTSLPIDVWGTGCPSGRDPRLKGTFAESEPYASYQFHVCIENYVTDSYFSEKIINCAMTRTMPVYLGARNLPLTCIRLFGTLDDDMRLLTSLCENPASRYCPDAIDDAMALLDIRPFLARQFDCSNK